ncbi:hypothetical protein KCU90_g10, partial [Aureobasidium melanogenum]
MSKVASERLSDSAPNVCMGLTGARPKSLSECMEAEVPGDGKSYHHSARSSRLVYCQPPKQHLDLSWVRDHFRTWGRHS